MSARDDYPAVSILHDAWTARDRNGEKAPEAVRMLQEIQRLREQNAAWMNGVADVVEPFGFDRQAACGPSDLLPGLTVMFDALIEAQRRLGECVDARSILYEQVHELTTRLERHPVTTGGYTSTTYAEVLEETRHRPIRQSGSNLCVCGAWFDAEVHQ